MLDRIVLFAAAAAAALPLPAQAAGEDVVVDARQFDCLVRRVDTIPREPLGVYVDISECVRRGGPSIFRAFVAPRIPPASGVEAILLVKPEHLACIRRHRRNIAAIVETRPQARYRLRWNPCPAR